MRRTLSLLLAAALVVPEVGGAVVGTNPPALPLTAERIAALPGEQRPAWEVYHARSQKLRVRDEAVLATELAAAGLAAPLVPAKGQSVPRNRPADFWATAEAARMADNVVTFQTPAGGWNKNTDHATAPRRTGERSGFEAGYVGTIDNDGTIAQLRFLARVIAASTAERSAGWKDAVIRGVEYLLGAQYPTGGWPQVFPLQGGYHDAITYNDGAMTNVLTLLREVASGQGEFAGAYLAPEVRSRAAAAADRGLGCLLASQIVVGGRRTVWGQQHDPITLAPCSARNYEMPSQASGESAAIFTYLLGLPQPSPAVVTAVHAAAGWFAKTALHDVAFRAAPDGGGRKLLPAPGGGPNWARYYEIGTDRPLFGDRDRTIHDEVGGLSPERRHGYAWFGDSPKRALDHYRRWAKDHPAAARGE